MRIVAMLLSDPHPLPFVRLCRIAHHRLTISPLTILLNGTPKARVRQLPKNRHSVGNLLYQLIGMRLAPLTAR